MSTDDVEAARRGDRRAFSRLVSRYQRLAVPWAASRVGPTEAEDAVQDAFIDAFRLLPQLREPAAFPGWLRKIVLKHCDRRTRRARPDISEVDVESLTVLEDALEDADRVRQVRVRLERSPEPERTVLALHDSGGASVAEIAAFLELSPAASPGRAHSPRPPADPADARRRPGRPRAGRAAPRARRIGRRHLRVRAR